MRPVFVAGIGMTPFGRSRQLEIKDLARQATELAARDAGISLDSIEAVFFANATQGHMEGQHMIRGEIAVRSFGIGGIPVVNVENACASGASAFALAASFVRSGEADIVLALGAEKMVSADRGRMFAAFDSAWDIVDEAAIRKRLMGLGEGVVVPDGSTSSKPYSVFMDVYAAFARQHMRDFGTTQAEIAAVSAKNHGHSIHNPLAQFREAFTLAEILAAPPITYPLTLPMCAPISDGGAAAILMSEEGLRRLNIEKMRAIRVLATVLQTGTDRDPSAVSEHLSARAARRAYEKAGFGPGDMSVAEVHDATAVGEIIQIENLGFCAFGDGGRFTSSGATTIGGKIPVNPSGGLESKGHPIGATGLGQIHELTTQLRGEAGARQVKDAKLAIAENGGGLHGIEEAVACVTILGR